MTADADLRKMIQLSNSVERLSGRNCFRNQTETDPFVRPFVRECIFLSDKRTDCRTSVRLTGTPDAVGSLRGRPIIPGYGLDCLSGGIDLILGMEAIATAAGNRKIQWTQTDQKMYSKAPISNRTP